MEKYVGRHEARLEASGLRMRKSRDTDRAICPMKGSRVSGQVSSKQWHLTRAKALFQTGCCWRLRSVPYFCCDMCLILITYMLTSAGHIAMARLDTYGMPELSHCYVHSTFLPTLLSTSSVSLVSTLYTHVDHVPSVKAYRIRTAKAVSNCVLRLCMCLMIYQHVCLPVDAQ